MRPKSSIPFTHRFTFLSMHTPRVAAVPMNLYRYLLPSFYTKLKGASTWPFGESLGGASIRIDLFLAGKYPRASLISFKIIKDSTMA